GETKIAELTSNTNVRVMQEASEIQAPMIKLVHNDNSDITHFSCLGAGWLKNVDAKTQQLQMAAQWQKELRKFPDPNSNLDILEFEKEAILQQPAEKMGLKAEFIRLWFERQSRKNKSTAPQLKQPREQANLRPK